MSKSTLDVLLDSFGANVASRALSIQFAKELRNTFSAEISVRYDVLINLIIRVNEIPNYSVSESSSIVLDFIKRDIADSNKERKFAYFLWGTAHNPASLSNENIKDWCFEIVEDFLEDNSLNVDDFYHKSIQIARQISIAE